MGSDQPQTANNGAGINADIQERLYVLQLMIERQQQQIKNLQEIVSGLQLENLQYRFSELRGANSDDITLYNDLEQRIVEQDREISGAYEEQLRQRAFELDTLNNQSRHSSSSRKLIDTNYVTHEANIKLDMEAVTYLEDQNPHRIARVTGGFEKRYGILVTDYYEFGFCDAPDAVINALNKKSDLEHLPRYRNCGGDDFKLRTIGICESIIHQWKTYNTPSVEIFDFSIAHTERLVEQVNDMIEILDDEIQDSSSDDTDLSDECSII